MNIYMNIYVHIYVYMNIHIYICRERERENKRPSRARSTRSDIRPFFVPPPSETVVSLRRKRSPLGPYRRPLCRVLGGSQGGGRRWALNKSVHTASCVMVYSRALSFSLSLAPSLTHSQTRKHTHTHTHTRRCGTHGQNP